MGEHVFCYGMSYWRIRLMVGHVFQVDISFRITCLTGVYILWKVMLCRRTCLIGHVMHQCMSPGWHILQEEGS